MSAVVSTYVHATEEEEKVIHAFQEIAQNIRIETTPLSGHHRNPILLLRAKIDRKEIRAWWDNFYGKLETSVKKNIQEKIETNIDQGCFLYLRFDKQKAYQGQLSLSDGDDVIHLKLKVSAYPSKPEVAARKVADFLEGDFK